jgi:hypothetical protein
MLISSAFAEQPGCSRTAHQYAEVGVPDLGASDRNAIGFLLMPGWNV